MGDQSLIEEVEAKAAEGGIKAWAEPRTTFSGRNGNTSEAAGLRQKNTANNAKTNKESNMNATINTNSKPHSMQTETNEVVGGFGFLGMWGGLVLGAMGLFDSTISGLAGAAIGIAYGFYVASKK